MNIVRDRYDVGPRTAALEELNGALMGAFFDEGRNPYEMKITGAVPTHQVEIERLNAVRFSIEYLLIEQGAPSMTGTVPAVRVGFQD